MTIDPIENVKIARGGNEALIILQSKNHVTLQTYVPLPKVETEEVKVEGEFFQEMRGPMFMLMFLGVMGV
jgi:hypothetical protein